MNIIFGTICFFIWTGIITAKGAGSPSKHTTLKSIPAVDALIQRLEAEEWTDDESCFGATLRILNGVRNDTLWATWVWDSMQLPMGVFFGSGVHLGNFDQCIRNPWSPQGLSTQYCLVEVKVQNTKEPREFGAYDSAAEYLNTISPYRRSFNHLAFAVCMPAVCSPSSVANYSRLMFQLSHIPEPVSIVVGPSDCQTAEPKPYPGKFYAYLSVIGVLSIVVVVSTIYSNCTNSNEFSKTDAIAKSFSMTHNWNDLFKVNKNELRVLNGMRVITATIVIGCHQAMLYHIFISLTTNSVEADEMFDTEIGKGLIHIDLVVDTFFTILIGLYAAATFYIICMARYTGSGPIWIRSSSYEEAVCEKHAWKNFLMLNYDFTTTCCEVSWYVNCDFHLAILTVVLFWIYRRRNRAGVVAFVAVGCVLITQVAIRAYNQRLPMAFIPSISDIADIREFKNMNEVYIRWHDRAGSYLVGVAMGWLMNVYKPADHRNVISKTRSIIIVLLSLYVMMKVATIGHWFSDAGRVPVAVAVATHRAVWAMAICVFIAACEYGSVPMVTDLLGSAFFVPISKLCYGIYMTHLFIIQRNLHTLRSLLYFDVFNVVHHTVGTFVLACGIALVLYMLVEAPCINISNLFLSERIEKAELNGKKPANGYYKEMNGISKVKTS